MNVSFICDGIGYYLTTTPTPNCTPYELHNPRLVLSHFAPKISWEEFVEMWNVPERKKKLRVDDAITRKAFKRASKKYPSRDDWELILAGIRTIPYFEAIYDDLVASTIFNPIKNSSLPRYEMFYTAGLRAQNGGDE